MVVAALFIGGINCSFDSFISILFVACMICLIVSFVLLFLEIFLATKTTRRNLIQKLKPLSQSINIEAQVMSDLLIDIFAVIF